MEFLSTPKYFYIRSKYSNLEGIYEKIDQQRYGCNVYTCIKNGVSLFKLANFWALGPSQELNMMFYVKSDKVPTPTSEPDEVNWTSDILNIEQYTSIVHSSESSEKETSSESDDL